MPLSKDNPYSVPPPTKGFHWNCLSYIPYNSRGLKVNDNKLKNLPVFPNLFYIVAHIEKKKMHSIPECTEEAYFSGRD